MAIMGLREFTAKLFATGKEQGFLDMEVYVERTEEFDVRVFKGEIDHYGVANTLGLGFRGIYNGKMGYSYTEKLDDESIGILLNDARENSLVIDSEDAIEIQPASSRYPQVETFTPDLEEVPADAKIALAKALESEALAKDRRIHMVNYAVIASGKEERQIINTKGISLKVERNSMLGYVSVVAKEGEDVKSVGKHQVVTEFAKLNPAFLAGKAVEEAVSLLGAAPVSSGTYPVILRADAAGALLATFAPVFSAERVQKGLSLLGDKLGEVISSEVVSIVDDPLMPYGPLSAPFDAEGVPTKTKRVVEQGRLTTFLHNSKTAAKAGVASTGNAYRSSFKAPVEVAPTNMFIERGKASFQELMGELGDGLIITELHGLHSGANPVSGDFSLAASGYLVSGGKIERPVEQITVAGNFFETLRGVVRVGDDLEFQMPGPSGYLGSPSLLVQQLAVAGK